MKKLSKRILALVLTVVMTMSLAACGREAGEEKKDPEKGQEEGYTWVPSYETLELGSDGAWIGNVRIKDGSMYYVETNWNDETQAVISQICKKDITQGTSPEVIYEYMTTEEHPENLQNYVILPDGKLACLFSLWSENQPETWSLRIFDENQEQVAETDISKEIVSDGHGYVSEAVSDTEGNLYLLSDSKIVVYNAQGSYLFDLKSRGGWIQGIGNNKDGNVIVSQNVGGGMEVSTVDAAKKDYGQTYKGTPDGGGRGNFAPGLEKDFLCNTNGGLIEYDSESESYETLLQWLDCDINQDYVEQMGTTPDGKIIVMIREWDATDNNYQICTLTKTLKSEIPEKETITFATMGLTQGQQNAIVKFNKSSSKYRITVINYGENIDYSQENAHQDAVLKFNNDIMTGNAADIIDLSSGTPAQYMNKGVIEDLTPYLEKSTVVNKEDFIQSVLNAYSLDGKLSCIPTSFTISTIVGKTSDVGDRMGWTVDEFMEFVDSKPADVKILQYASKNYMLNVMISCNEERYIDWTTGKCNFNSEEFKKVLEFANRFPSEFNWEEETESEYAQIAKGKLLLMNTGISEFRDVQMYNAMFGGEKISYIGFPTSDGTNGSSFSGNDLLGINSRSEHKDGAWEFIESLLTEEYQTGMFAWGLPTLQSAYDKKLSESMEKHYKLDENGEQVLDEDGNPIEVSRGGMSMDDFSIEYYAVTQEEADAMATLIANITNVVAGGSSNSEVYSIIMEEAAPYFAGQKSIDEVVDIIQKRAQIYISESM